MFTRQIYDQSAYEQDLSQWRGPSRYYLEPSTTHRGNLTCFQSIPEMHASTGQYRISDKNDMINIESDLYNLNRPATKDQYLKYPYINPQYSNQPSMGECSDAQDTFNLLYPKLEHSQFNREKQIHIPRFESLCLNPQDLKRIRSNNVIGLNTRLYNRDRYKCNRYPECASRNV